MGVHRQWTDEKLIQLGKDLVEHCKKDDVWHLTHFEVENELYDGCLEYLYQTYPDVFLPYYTRALRILGNKIFSKSMDGGGDRWVIKTYMPRYLNCREWIKEDLEMEAKAKAEALKSANIAQIPSHIEEFFKFYKKDAKTS